MANAFFKKYKNIKFAIHNNAFMCKKLDLTVMCVFVCFILPIKSTHAALSNITTNNGCNKKRNLLFLQKNIYLKTPSFMPSNYNNFSKLICLYQKSAWERDTSKSLLTNIR